MSKVTVIVPIYNVAQYIERCVRSLFEQTLCNIEFLFINDCTPDNSVEIVERLIAEYRSSLTEKSSVARILSMMANSGLAAVRRRGIIEAKGEYIIHCDGDDWVDVDLYLRMYEDAKLKDADIVMCGSIHEYENHRIVHDVEIVPNTCKEVVRNWYRNTIGMHCWNKMVRRALYVQHDVYPWEGLNMWEDNGLMARLFYYGGTLSSIKDSYYHYNRANGSAMTNGYGQKQVQQMIGIAQHLTDFFVSKDDAADFKQTVMAFQFLAKINLITDSFQRIREYNQLFHGSEQIASVLDINAFSKKGKIRYFMVKYHMALLFVSLFKVHNCFQDLKNYLMSRGCAYHRDFNIMKYYWCVNNRT